jgi:hypothetical protein
MIIPLWTLGAILLIYSAVLWKVHRATDVYIKSAIAVPGVCLALLFMVVCFFQLSNDFLSFVGRGGFILMFLWHTIILWLTRKNHAFYSR